MACVVVTGATGKIGTSVVRHLLAAGDTVVAVGSRSASVEELRDAVGSAEGGVVGFVLDLTAADAATRLAEFLDEVDLRPEGLVNGARSLRFLGTEQDGLVTRDNFTRELLLDVVVPYELTMALAAQDGSRLVSVVNLASMYGISAPNPALYGGRLDDSPISYGVAKAGLIQLTRELAVRLAPRVRVNAVSFGGVQGRVDEEFLRRYAALCPAGRMLDDDEVAGPIAFLLSSASSSMTGHNLIADGGWTIW